MSSKDEIKVDLTTFRVRREDVSEAVRSKAQDIAADPGAVSRIEAGQWQVRSTSGQVYRVQMSNDWCSCDCPYGLRKMGRIGCAHALAVLTYEGEA